MSERLSAESLGADYELYRKVMKHAGAGSMIGFLKFLLQTVGTFIGLLVGIVGFIWVIGSITSSDWLSALLGIPVLLFGAWLHFGHFNDT